MPFGLSPAPSRPHPIPTDVPVLGGVRAPGPHATGCARGPVSVAGVSLRSSRLTLLHSVDGPRLTRSSWALGRLHVWLSRATPL